MEEYDRRDVERLTQTSETTVQFYVRNGVVVPEISAPSGRGKALKFSRNNLIQFGMVKILQRDYGMLLLSMQAIFDNLRKGKWKDVNFNDFYTNSEWGDSKELVYVEKGGGARKAGFFIVRPDQPLPAEQLTQDVLKGGLRLLPLGLVKKQAEKDLGLG